VPTRGVAIYPFKREFVVGCGVNRHAGKFSTMCYLPGSTRPSANAVHQHGSHRQDFAREIDGGAALERVRITALLVSETGAERYG